MRGKKATKREEIPDPKFGSIVIGKLITTLMYDGKRTVAERVVYDAFDTISERTKSDPAQVFDEAMKNVSPVMEVRSKRIGGANYQIPFPVRIDRRQTLAFRWIIDAARKKKGAPMSDRLAGEIMDAAKKEGGAMKKRDEMHRMAEANRAFAHFAK